MGFVLTVYLKGAVKEIFLPGVNNRTINEVLEKDISGFGEDVNITLDVFENEWMIRSNEDLRFETDSILLKDGLRLNAVAVKNQTAIVILVGMYYPGMTEFEKYVFGGTKIEIGSGKLNQISYNTNNLVGEQHAFLEKVEATSSVRSSVLTDCDSINGTYVNGKRISGSVTLKYGDTIFIFGLKIVYLGDIIAVNHPKGKDFRIQSLLTVQTEDANIEPERPPSEEYYQRSPRRILQVDEEVIEIEAPPQLSSRRRTPLWMTIGPSFSMVLPMLAGILFTMYSVNSGGTMTSPFMFMGIVTSGTAAAIGVFWALSNYKYQIKMEREDEKNRDIRYKRYLENIEQVLQGKHKKNREILKAIHPEIHECLRWVLKQEAHIWEKNINHPDFLELRLGIGSCLAPNKVVAPKSRFSLIDDELAEKPFDIQKSYTILTDVPVTISLYKHNLVGVIGTRRYISEIVRAMAMQIAVLHSYTDVKMAFIYNAKENWDFVKWFPHTWAANSSIRMVASDSVGTGEVFYHLSGIIRDRINNAESNSYADSRAKNNHPHYVIFVTDPALVENEPIMKYLTSTETNVGFTTVLLYDRIDRLPNSCTVIIQKDENYNGYYSLNNSFSPVDNVEFDSLPESQASEVSKIISRFHVREAEGSGVIPQMLTFLDMHRTNTPASINVYRNWLENHTYESMKAVIGHRGGGTPLYLDIHEKYHGPHGLVAGTTGSGKSEMLQTYILSLALTYHPYEVSFILIDYKGGGMAESFRGLPHVAGIITNLGGNQTIRALASVNSEIKRRQAMFNKHGVKHIDGYIELYMNAKEDDAILESGPIPHLIIIADEFAELKKEQPEFISALVSAARVGRSLGVHLILATQKPDGLIDPQIESNTRFRVCLRVADKQDSVSMLKRPEAAYITNPGRGYFQVGNDEIFEEFQSGWSGAPYEPDVPYSDDKANETKMINLWGKLCVIRTKKKKNKTKEGTQKSEENIKKEIQLNALVKYIKHISEENNIETIESIWLPPLPKTVYLKDLKDYGIPTEEWILDPVMGLIDDPVNQEQRVLRLNFIQDGHMLLCGSQGSGKTTFLQTLIYSLITSKKPSRLNIYIADFGSRILGAFRKAPHVGDIVFDDDEDKTNKLVSMLVKELSIRKIKFSQEGVGTFKDYVMMCEKNQKADDCPAILFIIDNYSAFIGESNQRRDDSILLLVKEAASYGIYLVISCGNNSDVRGRIRQQISSGIGLQLADKFEYADTLGVRPETTAESNCPGRGLVKSVRKTEGMQDSQIVPLEFQTAICLETGAINEEIEKTINDMTEQYGGYKAPEVPQVPKNMGYDIFCVNQEVVLSRSSNLVPIGYDTEEAQLISIDFTEIFGFIISGAARTGKTNAFKVILSECVKADNDVYLIDTVDKRMTAIVREIPVTKHITSTDDIFNFFSEILIPEFKKRNKLIESKGGRKFANEALADEKNIMIFIHDFGEFLQTIYNDGRVYPFVEQMMKMGNNHKISIVGCITKEDSAMHSSKAAYTSFVSWKEGIHLGGAVDNQRIFEFELTSSERIRKLPSGQGHMIKDGQTIKVIMPVL